MPTAFAGYVASRAAEPLEPRIPYGSPAATAGNAPVARSVEPEAVPASGPAAAAVPAARGESEPEPDHAWADFESGSPDIPHPHPRHEDDEPHEEPDTAPNSGVPGPGPGVAEIVAQAVARAMEDDDTQDLPHVCAPHRGTAVTEVPVSLPFRAASTTLLPKREPAATPRPARPARPAPGRRVPRGDDRLREHRGPVLPGWVGVAVGGLALAGCTAVLWRAGAVPDAFAAAFGAAPRAYHGLRATHWPPLAFLGIVALVALGGLGRARTGHAWVLTLFGRYRGTVRRTGLTWVSPLLLRRRVDVRLRHWRSDPMPAVDSGGLALQVVVQVVWQVKDTARATLAVADHTEYLAEQVESAMARVLSQLPADAFHEDAPTLRDAEAVGDALTRMLAAETEAVGIEVFSAQPTRIEYAAEVAEAMRRRRVAAIDAKHRDTVLTSVVDAVDDTVHRLTSRGLVELDDYERKVLVKDLTVAFYTGRTE
ncbi:SPFH domain-containing protein [Streptomyces sp. A0592]|uniref:SPFH domain-containing protein n=1 Tax=Streptomyces sp. A0592 TaxID=2563099 RepID=UPI001F0D28BC|nr:SPFH domain-containing protein [Streptomyces sp. A0592]